MIGALELPSPNTVCVALRQSLQFLQSLASLAKPDKDFEKGVTVCFAGDRFKVVTKTAFLRQRRLEH